MARAFLVSGRSCFELTEETKTLGRSYSADYIVLDVSVSRKHAEIAYAKNVVSIKDLGSRNGTYVESGQVSSCEVGVGSSVRFGKILFRIENEESSMASMASEVSSMSTIDPTIVLSPAQKKVLDRMLTGLSEKEVAAILEISHHTVHNHVREIYSRLGVNSRAELMAKLLTKENPVPLKRRSLNEEE
jgi:DNA-binding CsgD family transcriptional regulator